MDVTSIGLDKTELTLTAGGETATLAATVLPEDASDKNVAWTSSDTGVATVADGVVTPVSEGSTTITATAGGFSAECSVTVSAANVAATGVTLDQHELTLTVGTPGTLTATVTPENATNKKLTWISSAEAVATVENGVVTPVAMGTATITATTEDGEFSDSCVVTVKEKALDPDDPLSGFTFKIWGGDAEDYIGSEVLNLVPNGDGTYKLIAPTYAVFPSAAAKLIISAPEKLTDEYTVTYSVLLLRTASKEMGRFIF